LGGVALNLLERLLEISPVFVGVIIVDVSQGTDVHAWTGRDGVCDFVTEAEVE
jgi:hypothetical protein